MRFSNLCFRAVILFAVAVPIAPGTPATEPRNSQYSDSIQLDLRRVPFSRFGSYLAFSHLSRDRAGEAGLYLRSVHDSPRQEIMRLDLLIQGKPVVFSELATPTKLRLEHESAFVEICMAEPALLRFRLHGAGLRFSKIPGTGLYGLLKNAEQVELNSPEQDIELMVSAPVHHARLAQTWTGTSSTVLTLDLLPAKDGEDVQAFIEEFRGSWTPRIYEGSFSEAVSKLETEYRSWLNSMPSVPSQLQGAADLAAYIDWSAVVRADGEFSRPAMLMSKNWMNAVWSWDHCFNAMLLANSQPELAWDQFMLVLDKQNKEGALPDRISDRKMIWAFSKPPVHGWTLQWMMAHSSLMTQARIAEAYQPLKRWTNWYFKYRDDDHDGLPQYNHGNDSGWDNATVFAIEPAIETPDLASLLVLQMETLSAMAERLHRMKEATEWKERSGALLQLLLKNYWKNGRFVALRSGDHSDVIADSLLLYVPLVLGKRLPMEVRQELVADLREPGGFLTSHGLATEKIGSPLYEADGYWRGPIWAPSSMMIVEGLDAVGEKEFARELRRKYCEMVSLNGMAENYDAITGQNLRDPDYTWSASVFLLFAHELDQP